MALLTSEVDACRYHCGYNVLSVGAEPYVGVTAMFEQVIGPYTRAGAATTSSTAVTAASVATPATLTLAAATGFNAGDRVVIDVDARQEEATIQSVSGSDIVVLLTGVHSGTYPVTVEGGETIVRRILSKLRDIEAEFTSSGLASAGVKQADEVHFFGESEGSRSSALRAQLMMWRDQLCAALGVVNLWRVRASGGLEVSPY